MTQTSHGAGYRARMLRLGALAFVLFVSLADAQSATTSGTESKTRVSEVRLTFVAKSDSFALAAREYEQLWATDGKRIIATMERIAGLSFRYPQFSDTAITVTVLEGVSNSGYRNVSGIEMRASYALDTKRAALVHELGHRLMAGLYTRNEQEHGALFLWLYDVWVALYGQKFTDEQIAIERGRGGPYPEAWDAATRLSASERAAAWRNILAERMPRRS